MRRVMLLTLLALALPTAMFANSFTFNSGDFQSGSVSGGLSGLTIDVTGTIYRISLSTGPLTLDSSCFVSGATCYSWPGAMVEVFSPSKGLVFQNTLNGGTIATTGVINPTNFVCLSASCSFAIAAGLEPDSKVDEGSTSFSVVVNRGDEGVLSAGGATVTFQKVPEPATIEGLLFGTGMIGLAEMARRKLVLGM
jgi:hypothetical protein